MNESKHRIDPRKSGDYVRYLGQDYGAHKTREHDDAEDMTTLGDDRTITGDAAQKPLKPRGQCMDSVERHREGTSKQHEDEDEESTDYDVERVQLSYRGPFRK